MQVHALSPAGSLADKPLPRAKFNARSSFLFYVPDYASEVATSLLRILLFQPTFPTNFNIMYLKYSTIIFRAYYYYQIYHLHTWEFSRQFRELGRIRPQRVIVHYFHLPSRECWFSIRARYRIIARCWHAGVNATENVVTRIEWITRARNDVRVSRW